MASTSNSPDEDLETILHSLESFEPVAGKSDLKLSSELFDKALQDVNQEYLITVPCQWDSDYQLIEKLGGGMSQVFLAEQTKLGNSFVVVKVIKHLTHKQQQLLEAESQTLGRLARLNLQSVVLPLMRREFNGAHYFVMEYVRGENLRQIIDNGKQFDSKSLIKTMLEFSQAFSAIHEAEVIHGDIKPSNLMIDETGAVRIIDFGLSGLWAQVDPGYAGTRQYSSPEQLAGNEIDERADIFSLGRVFENLIESTHFTSDQQEDELSAIAAKMVSPESDSRFQTMAEVHSALATAMRVGNSGFVKRLAAGTLIAAIAVALFFASKFFKTNDAYDSIDSQAMKVKTIEPVNVHQESVMRWVEQVGGTFETNAKNQIVTIKLDRCDIVDSDLAQLKSIETLEAIRLAHTNVSPRCLQHLPDHVEYIYLDHTNVGDEVVSELARFRLRVLSICYTKVTDKIGPVIGAMPSLEQLSIEYTQTSDAIAHEIAKLNRLRMLSLCGTKFSDRGVETISNAKLRLSQIHLARCLITDRSLVAISTIPSLRELGLDYCKQYTNDGFSKLANLKQLEFLGIRECQLVESEVVHTVNQLPSLRQLNIVSAPKLNVASVRDLVDTRITVR